MADITLSADEIADITHYKRPAEQLRLLLKMGIPASRRPDNTVCVLRMHVTQLAQVVAAANDAPQLKSSRK